MYRFLYWTPRTVLWACTRPSIQEWQLLAMIACHDSISLAHPNSWTSIFLIFSIITSHPIVFNMPVTSNLVPHYTWTLGCLHSTCYNHFMARWIDKNFIWHIRVINFVVFQWLTSCRSMTLWIVCGGFVGIKIGFPFYIWNCLQMGFRTSILDQRMISKLKPMWLV